MKIHISEPCHEKWDTMSPNDKGRHCKLCSKTVVDFTQMTDYGISMYFKNNSNVCGKFYDFQLNREINEPKDTKIVSKYYSRLAAIGISMSQFFNLQSQNPDTINFNQTQISNSTQSPHIPKQFKIEMLNNDSILKNIHSLQFIFNDFRLDTTINKQNIFNFQVPDSILWSEVKISIIDTSEKISTIIIPNKAFVDIFFPKIKLYYDNEWKYQIESEWLFVDPYPKVTMGIPMQNHRWDINIPLITVGYTIINKTTIGDTISKDYVWKDSLKFKQKLETIKKNTQKDNLFFHYLLTLLLFLTGIWIVIKEIFRK